MKFTSRALHTTDDEEFFFNVYASTRAEELAALPWTPDQKMAFLRMQSNAQLIDYRRNHPQVEFHIVEKNRTPVGRLIVDRSGNSVSLLDIALLPEYRNAGIGTALLQDLMAEAQEKGQSVILHVETFNPARQLYTRLGFIKVKDLGFYHEMKWEPTPMLSPSANQKA